MIGRNRMNLPETNSLVLLLLIRCLLISCGEDSSIVTITQGKLRGLKISSNDGVSYWAFKGIYYAKPPFRDLRFKSPVKVDPWDGVVDATEDGHICPQYDLSSQKTIGDENCLCLNVYTTRTNKKQPVIAFIHGGAFIQGGASSYFYEPDFFMSYDVVVVTIQYRLGAFGMDSEDGSAPGNYALDDQVLALKWIKENIQFFGGDSSKVTLLGDEAGGASATYLLLSPQARGLFTSVIALTGNAISDIYYQRNPKQTLNELATRLDCAKDFSIDTVNCIRRKSIGDIIERSNSIFAFYTFPRLFAPVIDKRHLHDEPLELFSKGEFNKVPMIIGNTRDEGAFFYRLLLNTFYSGNYDDNFLELKLPKILPIISRYNNKLHSLMKAIKKRYFASVNLDNEKEFKPRFIEFLTDIMFTRFTDKFAQILANHSVPVFVYNFDYIGEHSVLSMYGDEDDKSYVTHRDDIQYLFPNVWGEDYSLGKADREFGKSIFIPMLINFVNDGHPTSKLVSNVTTVWAPYVSNIQRYFHVNTQPRLENDFKKKILKFWYENVAQLMHNEENNKFLKTEL